MPRMKKPRKATLDEVIISRDGEYGVITFRDPTVGGMNLKIGPEITRMTDREILDCYNETVLAMQRSAASYRHKAMETPREDRRSAIPSSATSGCRAGTSCAA